MQAQFILLLFFLLLFARFITTQWLFSLSLSLNTFRVHLELKLTFSLPVSQKTKSCWIFEPLCIRANVVIVAYIDKNCSFISCFEYFHFAVSIEHTHNAWLTLSVTHLSKKRVIFIIFIAIVSSSIVFAQVTGIV